MPPRQYVPSTCAGHTRSCRSAPTRPISSCVWTAPGRSTMTTRPGVVGGDRRHRTRLARGARPGAQGLAEQRVQVDAGQVADDDRGGRGGPDVPVVEGAYGRRVDPLDGLLGALARAATCARSPGTAPWRAPWRPGGPGLASSCGISSRRLRDQPLDLARRRRRAPCRASASRPSALAQAGGRHLQAEAQTRVVGVRVQGGAAALQFGGELLGGVLVGALGEGAAP